MFQGRRRPIADVVDVAVAERDCVALQAPVSLARLSLSDLLGQEKSRNFDLAQGPVRISRDGLGFLVVLNLPLNPQQTLQIQIMDCYDPNSRFVRGFSEYLERVQSEEYQHDEVLRRPGKGYAHETHKTPGIDLSVLLKS